MVLPFAGLGLPEQAMRGLGLVLEDKPTELKASLN